MPECPYCGDGFEDIRVHQMKCVAEQVAQEQRKVIFGIAREIEERDNEDKFEDIVDQLQYSSFSFPTEMKKTLEEEMNELEI
jgi:hypothetical protein